MYSKIEKYYGRTYYYKGHRIYKNTSVYGKKWVWLDVDYEWCPDVGHMGGCGEADTLREVREDIDEYLEERTHVWVWVERSSEEYESEMQDRADNQLRDYEDLKQL